MKIRMLTGPQDKEHFIKSVAKKYHFEPEAEAAITAVYEEMQKYLKPYAVYRMNQRDTGIKEIDNRQSAIVAMTLGNGVDMLKDSLTSEGKLDEAYILECISSELLLAMYSDFNKEYAKFHRRYVERYVFIGDEIPVTVIPKLLKEVKGVKISANSSAENDADSEPDAESEESEAADGKNEDCYEDDITSNEYGVLMPSKSVIFYAILTENPNQICEGVCTSCRNVNCENMTNKEALSMRQPYERLSFTI